MYSPPRRLRDVRNCLSSASVTDDNRLEFGCRSAARLTLQTERAGDINHAVTAGWQWSQLGCTDCHVIVCPSADKSIIICGLQSKQTDWLTQLPDIWIILLTINQASSHCDHWFWGGWGERVGGGGMGRGGYTWEMFDNNNIIYIARYPW